MRRLSVMFVLLLSVGTVFAATEAPKVPEQVKVKILQLQLRQEQVKTRALQLQNEMNDLTTQFNKNKEELDAAQKEAYEQAKVTPKEYNLDLTKLEFVAVPAPAKPAEGAKKP